MVAVVIPITNKPYYLEHIQECLESIRIQTKKPQVIIVEDGPCPIFPVPSTLLYKRVFVAARVGVPNAFNIGIATAFNMGQDKVLMMGCDDILTTPTAIEEIETKVHGEGFHWLDLIDQDDNRIEFPTGHAVVTRNFWPGYPIEAPLGCDSVLLNLIDPDDLHHIEAPYPYIQINRNSETYTGSRDSRWLDIIFATRALLKELQDERI